MRHTRAMNTSPKCTFLPYPSFEKSAKALDIHTLGKQRLLTVKIIKVLEGEKVKSLDPSHPVVKMWEGYLPALKNYFNIIIKTYVARGQKNILKEYPSSVLSVKYPPWFNSKNFHYSHMAYLLRKDPEFYGKVFGKDLAGMAGEFLVHDLVWPSLRPYVNNLDLLSVSKLAEKVVEDRSVENAKSVWETKKGVGDVVRKVVLDD